MRLCLNLDLDLFSIIVQPYIIDGLFLLVSVSHRNHTVVNSKVIAVTVRPEPKVVVESHLEIELAHLANVSTSANTGRRS